MLATLNPGNLEPQEPQEPQEPWQSRTLEPWNFKTCSRAILLRNLGTLPDNIATLEPWSLLLGFKAGLILDYKKKKGVNQSNMIVC